MTFAQNITGSLMFCFSSLKETLSCLYLKLSMTYDRLIKYTLIFKDETFSFSSLSDPSRIWKLLGILFIVI